MTDLATKGFSLGDWRVSPAEGILSRGDEVVHLEPKAMEVLVYLASRPGEVITREELERDVWRGALVGYDAVTNTVIKLRKALGDDARKPRFIATIPKKGYQLIASPRESDGEAAAASAVKPATVAAGKFAAANSRLLGFGLMAIVVIVGLMWIFLTTDRDSQKPPSIAVLPFENLNADPKQDFLADGITEDLITDLSKLSSIQVIASNSSSAFRGKQASIKQIGEELKVTYVVKGTVRRLSDDFRVNVQLVNAETGFNTWAARYDRKVKEVFAIQDDVTRNIVRILAIQTTQQEETRLSRKATSNLEAYDYFQEGMRHYRAITREGNELARQSYRKAIELDPNYGRAYGAISVTLATDYRWGWTDNPSETLEHALELATRAVQLDPASPQTHWALGFVRLARREYSDARTAAEKSIEVAPNYADGYGLLGIISANQNEPNQAIKYTRRGMELNPYYTWEYLYTLGMSYHMLEDYDKAIEVLEEAQARNGNVVQVKLYLAACYVRVNRLDDAEWMVEQLQVITPSTLLSTLDKTLSLSNSAARRTLLADLKRAGLPE